MGKCCSVTQIPRNIDNLHEFDKIIILSHEFMKDKLSEEQLKELLSSLLLEQLKEEKSDETKRRHFLKWISMSTNSKQIPFCIDTNHIINLNKKQKNKERKKSEETPKTPQGIFFKNKGLSYTEESLRIFFAKNGKLIPAKNRHSTFIRHRVFAVPLLSYPISMSVSFAMEQNAQSPQIPMRLFFTTRRRSIRFATDRPEGRRAHSAEA